MPKIAKAAASDELRNAFEEHLEETKEHVSLREKLFEVLCELARGRKCEGMEGLVEEGSNIVS